MRNVTVARPEFHPKDLSFIILAAGSGRRTRSVGNKSLVNLEGKNLIEKQIEAIRLAFSVSAEIIVVLGFESEKILRILPAGVKSVENPFFEQNSAGRSIGLGLRATNSENIFLIHGDIFFNDLIFKGVKPFSSIFYANGSLIDQTKASVIQNGGFVTSLSFSDYVLDKWAQIVYLSGQELQNTKKIVWNRQNDKMCTFEVINKVIDKGGKFLPVRVDSKCGLREFNHIKEMQ